MTYQLVELIDMLINIAYLVNTQKIQKNKNKKMNVIKSKIIDRDVGLLSIDSGLNI